MTKEDITLRYCKKCKKFTLQVRGALIIEAIWQNATHLVEGATILDDPWYCSRCGKIWIPCEAIRNFDKELKD